MILAKIRTGMHWGLWNSGEMIGNCFCKGAVSFNMLLWIMCILSELENCEGLGTTLGLCVNFSVLSLYSPVLSHYHLLFLLTLCLSHIFLPTTSEVVDFLRHWPCGVGGKNIQGDIIGENGDIYLKTHMTKGRGMMVVFKCHRVLKARSALWSRAEGPLGPSSPGGCTAWGSTL